MPELTRIKRTTTYHAVSPAQVGYSPTKSKLEIFGGGVEGPISQELIRATKNYLDVGDHLICFMFNRKAWDEDIRLDVTEETVTEKSKHGFVASNGQFYSYIDLLIGHGVKPLGYDWRHTLVY